METAFISCEFKKWGKATKLFVIHQKSNYHKEALCKVVGCNNHYQVLEI